MEVGLVHQLGVIWPREFNFEVISQFWSDVWALGHLHGVINGGFLELCFYKELMPRTRLFKVQGMGHG